MSKDQDKIEHTFRNLQANFGSKDNRKKAH